MKVLEHDPDGTLKRESDVLLYDLPHPIAEALNYLNVFKVVLESVDGSRVEYIRV